MTYTAVWIAVSLTAGMAIAPHCPAAPMALWLGMIGALAAALLGCRVPRWVRMGSLLVTVMLLGLLCGSRDVGFPDWLIRRAPGIREITGTIVTYPEVGAESAAFTLVPQGLPGRLWVVYRGQEPLGAFHYGDVVRVIGSTRLPTAFEGFDYPAYLARRGIFATLFADEASWVEPGSTGFSLWGWGDRLRQRLIQRLRDAMPPDVAAMAQSLMLGDRSALAPDAEDAFSRTGLMHLLAVSGLHLGIFLGGAWWGLRRFGVRPRVAYPLVGLLVLLGLIVVGPRVSLVRAGLLFAFLALGSVLADCGVILRRWIHPLNGLAAAAIAILVMRPGSLYDAGFQLTMAATGSILIAFSPSGWGTRLARSARVTAWWKGWQWLAGLMLVSAAAQAGAAPVIAWHFQAFHPLSILVNLVAVPLAGLALWAGLFYVLCIGTPAGALAAAPFRVLLEGLDSMVADLARVPFSQLPASPGMGVWMAGLAAFLVLAAYWTSLLQGPRSEERESGANPSHFSPASSWTSKSTSMESDALGGDVRGPRCRK
jgi:ComEC/Rec2-related protein